MDLIGDGKRCEEVCKYAPPEKGKWPCEDCDMRWHDRAEPPKGGMNMKHDFSLKRREERKLPPERLYVILRGIYPKEIADEKYTELTGLTPPEEET